MNSTTQLGKLIEFAGVLSSESRPELVLDAALPALVVIAEAEAGLVVSQTADGPKITGSAGLHLDLEAVHEIHAVTESTLIDHAVPGSWEAEGIIRVASKCLPGHAGVLVLAWGAQGDTQGDAQGSDQGSAEDPGLGLALATLDTSLRRAQAEENLADLATRVDHAQHLANMGDYDWHISTDVNTWSDQLFRIYGHEPQSFHPSYETFLSLIHPDDRERISGVHQQAYATGEPYQMIERIVRPDGEVRYLSSNGEVIMDADSQPVRMRGTCIDITDRVLAEQERERIATRFQGLVNSAPDAILVLDEQHQILEANVRAYELLGGDPQGHRIEQILPGWPHTGTTGVDATGLDGSTLALDVITVGVNPVDDHGADDALAALYLRDARPRIEGEALAARLGEAQLRRRQALEINDNVVQGLVAAVYALDQSEVHSTKSYLDRTLTAARAMMDDLLDPLDGVGLQPGDLVRTGPAFIGSHDEVMPASDDQVVKLPRSHRVLVVDDAEDLRMLLRTRVESYEGLVVVGEAADGVSAVQMASELQPDLVLLDLAMPRMDGLEALPLIRAAVPGVRVIVLSGFNQSTLAQRALEAGADHYVVKGGSMTRLLELVDSLLAPAS